MSHLDEGTLHALLDGEIPSEELAPVLAHLEGCADCRALLEEARSLSGDALALVESLGDGAPRVAVSPTNAPAAVIPLAVRSRAPFYRHLAWAATVVIAAGAGFWTGGRRGEPAPQPASQLVVEGTAYPLVFAAESTQGALAPPTPGSDAAAPSPQATTTNRAVTTTPTTTRERAERAEAREMAKVGTPLPAPVAKTATANLALAAAGDSGRAAAAAWERLAELHVTLVPEPERLAVGLATGRVGARTPTAPAPELAARSLALRSDVATESYAPIAFPEAIARLGGILRLVEGLVPDRLEASTTTVRVVYPLATGELVLEQRRQGDSIVVALRGPLSADSLAVLRGRIR
jgi:hypothetical protein